MCAEQKDRGIVEIPLISIEKAQELTNFAIVAAKGNEVTGFFVVFSPLRLQLCSEAVDLNARPLNNAMALSKIKTVLATRRSTTVQKERMENNSQKPEDFGGLLGTLLGGGLAVFADQECTQFIAAIAFSGGTPQQNNAICLSAVEKCGLYTDFSKTLEVTTTKV